jgi:hypothetical protein
MIKNSPSGDMEYRLSRAEALLAGTFALMTGYAQARCDNGRQVMTAKIVANLSLMTELCAFSPQFQAAVSHLRKHWQGLQAHALGAAADRALWHWHAQPSSLQ